DARRHVGELPLDHPEARDRLAELSAVARVVERDRETLLGRADRAGTELEAADVEDVERDLVALADLAEDGVGGHLDVLEDQLARRRAADAELLLLRPGRKPLRRLLDDERGEVLAVDLREDREDVREAGIRDELLRARQAISA